MTMVILLLSIGLVLLLFIQLSYGIRSHVPGGVVLLGVGIPEHAARAEELEHLRVSFRRSNMIFIVAVAPALLPLLALSRYFSIVYIYWWVWLGVVIWAGYRLFVKYHRAVARVKRERDWSLGERRVVRADTTLIPLKKQMSLSLWWFAAPFMLNLAVLLRARPSLDKAGLILGFEACIITGLFLLLAIAFRRMPTKVYSTDSKVNAALNRMQRRAWSLLFLAMPMLNAAFAATVVLPDFHFSACLETLWYFLIAVQAAVPFAVAWHTKRKMSELGRRLREAANQPLYIDDDDYWINGITYYNLDDRSVLVPRRTGTGLTFNMAARGGRIAMGVTIGLAAVLIAGLAVFFIREDWMEPRLLLGKSGTVSVQSPSYGYTFLLEEIRELRLEEKLPGGKRTNGMATDRYARGHFRLEGWGNTRLYIFKHSPPYVVIRLADGYVVFNDRSAGDTLKTFEELKRKVPPYLD